jgi:hypothetical protein
MEAASRPRGHLEARQARAVARGGGKMWFVWTPQRVRIVIYFLAGYIALC